MKVLLFLVFVTSIQTLVIDLSKVNHSNEVRTLSENLIFTDFARTITKTQEVVNNTINIIDDLLAFFVANVKFDNSDYEISKNIFKSNSNEERIINEFSFSHVAGYNNSRILVNHNYFKFDNPSIFQFNAIVDVSITLDSNLLLYKTKSEKELSFKYLDIPILKISNNVIINRTILIQYNQINYLIITNNILNGNITCHTNDIKKYYIKNNIDEMNNPIYISPRCYSGIELTLEEVNELFNIKTLKSTTSSTKFTTSIYPNITSTYFSKTNTTETNLERSNKTTILTSVNQTTKNTNTIKPTTNKKYHDSYWQTILIVISILILFGIFITIVLLKFKVNTNFKKQSPLFFETAIY